MSLDLVLNSAAMQLPPSKLIARLGRPPPSPLEVAERIEHKALRSSALSEAFKANARARSARANERHVAALARKASSARFVALKLRIRSDMAKVRKEAMEEERQASFGRRAGLAAAVRERREEAMALRLFKGCYEDGVDASRGNAKNDAATVREEHAREVANAIQERRSWERSHERSQAVAAILQRVAADDSRDLDEDEVCALRRVPHSHREHSHREHSHLTPGEGKGDVGEGRDRGKGLAFALDGPGVPELAPEGPGLRPLPRLDRTSQYLHTLKDQRPPPLNIQTAEEIFASDDGTAETTREWAREQAREDEAAAATSGSPDDYSSAAAALAARTAMVVVESSEESDDDEEGQDSCTVPWTV